MSNLREQFEEYLEIRRSLGFKLQTPAGRLRTFVALMEGEGASRITTELALRWATSPRDVQLATWSDRLATVRRFAIWLSAMAPGTEIPPAGLLPHRYHRKPPYIYSDDEIERLVRVAGDLPSSNGLRAHTYTTLFGLLAVTGMRVSEAVALDRKDLDLPNGAITIRQAKFGKSRIVMVHSSTADALDEYAKMRDALLPVLMTQAYFVSEGGVRITGGAARYTFAKVSREIGLRKPIKGCGACAHGFLR